MGSGSDEGFGASEDVNSCAKFSPWHPRHGLAETIADSRPADAVATLKW